ncbi:MAG: GHKL domain-containing protein [Bacteroidales bacterium]|nr:GHKL domain-containing protein [Candidatus Cryptobacteroides equifaecalis]
MRRKPLISDIISVLLVLASVVLIVSTTLISRMPGDTEISARRMERRLESRMAVLQSYVLKGSSEKLPQDMVMYRYVNDSLRSWQNQFPISNDDISNKVVFKRLVNPRRNMESPLVYVSDEPSFMNLGPKWYLVRSYDTDTEHIIAGLEIMNTMGGRSFNGVNPRFRLGPSFSVRPLSTSGGSEVCYDGIPQFKILCDALTGGAVSAADDGGIIWMSFMIFILACFISLKSHPGKKVFALYAIAMLISCGMMYVWSFAATDMPIFSPLLFAGGKVLHSLGSVIIINIFILSLASGLYVVRKSHSIPPVVIIFLAVGILLYAHTAIKSIIQNSNIQLEVYDIAGLSWWSVIVYVSFLSMLMSVPMLLKLLDPFLARLFGRDVDVLDARNVVVMTAFVAIYMVSISSVHGFRKEEGMVGVWANRLAVDRDIILEMRLRRVETGIADDMIIASLSSLDNSEAIIRNFVTDNYLQSVNQDYNIDVQVIKDDSPADELNRMSARLKGAVPLKEGSYFMYKESRSGLPAYSAVFLYGGTGGGFNRVMISIEPKFAYGDRGYLRLLGEDHPGRISLPAKYAYARYKGRQLYSFDGNYPYPVRMDDQLFGKAYGTPQTTFKVEGYRHFVNQISDNEVVVISRPLVSWFNYLTSVLLISLIAIMMLFVIARKRHFKEYMRNYFKARLTWVMMVALVLTLLAMASASIYWMYSRNNANINTILSDKANSIQSLIQGGVQQVEQSGASILPLLESAAENTGSDITLYFPDGRLLASTAPEIFDRNILGSRIDQVAFDNIMSRNRRFFVNREIADGKEFYCIYAPVMNSEDECVAILGSPYAGNEIYDFETDTMKNLFSITTLFLVLLLLARMTLLRVLDKMFDPLVDMAEKMAGSDLESLQHISYDRDDEVAVLVNAYNRMVTQLSENSRTLAQAERDKAWSGMARQVAHEIKNPLTPMKLQLQRIIRLKAKGDPEWQNKFDDMSKVILDHIDVLTDTANEFSTFAKLYAEEPAKVNLDVMLHEEISMFDNRDNIKMEYMGFPEAWAMAPKPQLTRVFVNLINNAVQAVENMDEARIMVSLRNSSEDGYYDIVFEDNGPGVSEENISKLFTPNFTTKSAGSGLGLAISRSILERCDATITYSRSFYLGGACFMIRYPKMQAEVK